jgi:hypothetical protein
MKASGAQYAAKTEQATERFQRARHHHDGLAGRRLSASNRSVVGRWAADVSNVPNEATRPPSQQQLKSNTSIIEPKGATDLLESKGEEFKCLWVL